MMEEEMLKEDRKIENVIVPTENTKIVTSGSSDLSVIDNANEVHYGFNGEEFITGAVITSTDMEIVVDHSMDDRFYLFYDGINPVEDKYQLVQEIRDGVLYAGIKGVGEMLVDFWDTITKFFSRLFGKNKEITDKSHENQIISLLTPPENLCVPGKKRILVFVPEGMSNVEFRSVSGSITVNNTSAEKITAKSVSGEIKINNINSREAVIGSTSGKIEVYNSGAEIFTVKSISSEIVIDNINSRETLVSDTSGSINVTNSGVDRMTCKSISGKIFTEYLSTGEFKVSSTSGSIKSGVSALNVTAKNTSGATQLELHGNINNGSVSSVSGSVDVNIIDEKNLAINTATTSGRVNVNYLGINGNNKGNYLVGAGGGILDIKTVSGSIGVR